MSRILYMAFAMIIGVAGLAFHVRNNQPITLDYFAGDIALDLSWIVVACVVIGVALGATAMGVTVIRLRHELRGMNRRCEKAEREVSSLRDMKLKDVG